MKLNFNLLRKNGYLAAIMVLGLFFAFFRLGERHIFSKDEGRYAEIPREMLESKDFVTPHLNYVKYFEKPAFSYWLTAASMAAFGKNGFGARLPLALLGFLTILAVYLLGKNIFGEKTGFFSAVILLATTGFFLVNRFLLIDGPFTFFFTASMCLFYAGYAKNKGWCFLSSYVFMGLAALTKGLIGIVLPALIIGTFILISKDFSLLKRSRIIKGGILFLLVTAPWFIIVSIKNPQFFNFFFIHEHFYRYLTNSAGREEPFYFFFLIGAAFFFPWTVFIPFMVKDTVATKDHTAKKSLIFLNIWWVSVLFFFSLSRSKLPPYILPMVPPLAILAGKVWQDYIDNDRYAKGMKAAFVFLSLLMIGFIPFAIWQIKKEFTGDIDAQIASPYIYSLLIVFFIEAVFLLWVVLKLRGKEPSETHALKTSSFASIICMVFTALILVTIAAEKMNLTQSSFALASEIKKTMTPQSKVAVFEGYGQFGDLGFYLHKRIILVGDTIGELEFGKNTGDNKDWFISFERFKDIFKGDEKVYCVMKVNKFNELFKDKISGYRILKETPNGIVIVNERDK